jgi:predicted ribosome quality control (RQC) complex YloA/Tae2 family protein
MTDEIKNTTISPAADAGTAPQSASANPNVFASTPPGPAAAGTPNTGAAAAQAAAEELVSKKLYEDLQGKLTEQGNELGDLRKFFEEVRPLMDVLNDNPAIVEAIATGKITTDLAKAVMEGKVAIQDAKAVTKAHEEVKKDLGSKYQETKVEDIEKMVAAKAEETKSEVLKTLQQNDEERKFLDKINKFIESHDDFPQYVREIDEWMDEHGISDVSVGYEVIKARALNSDTTKRLSVERAEAAKEMAANASSGAGNSGGVISGAREVDKFIGSHVNPNVFE